MKYALLVLFIALVVGAGLGLYALLTRGSEGQGTPLAGRANEKQDDQVPLPPVELKPFTLKAVGGSGVAGDGSLSLKAGTFSFALRLSAAPVLAGEQKYEVYILPAGSAKPEFAGELLSGPPSGDKYIGGGSGEPSWFEAVKIIVTRRSPAEAMPGKVVAEAVFSN